MPTPDAGVCASDAPTPYAGVCASDAHHPTTSYVRRTLLRRTSLPTTRPPTPTPTHANHATHARDEVELDAEGDYLGTDREIGVRGYVKHPLFALVLSLEAEVKPRQWYKAHLKPVSWRVSLGAQAFVPYDGGRLRLRTSNEPGWSDDGVRDRLISLEVLRICVGLTPP